MFSFNKKHIIEKFWVLKKPKYYTAFGIIIIFIVLNYCFPPQLPNSYSTVILDQDQKPLSRYLNADDKWRFKTERVEVSPFFEKAILEKEDKYFFLHPGVNPLAIIRAGLSNFKTQKRVSGASTITMQVVRMLNPQKRSYWNKTVEILKALQLELYLSKSEILGLYYSLIPYGSNIEGVKAASYIYLGKPPKNLNLAEALILSIIPNRPSLLNANNSDQELENFKQKWLNRFEKQGIFKNEEISFAKSQKVHLTRSVFQKKAPHFCDRLKENNQSTPYILSTLDASLQQQTEKQVQAYLDRLAPIGLKNAVVMVVDNRTMEVKVYCGSGDYLNRADGGQVDGIRAVRSPGSTLKPFLYAYALEKGIINPKAIMYDIPSDFNGFKPINFDKTFNGQISMSQALQQSLNIPAVALLDQFGIKNFIVELKKAHFESIKSKEDELGLSMILGGCGVRMEEMMKAYATLANSGKYQELKYQKNENIGPSKKLLTQGSTYIISQILSDIQRPDFPNNFEFTFRLPKVAWKTGTSFGKRDAWAFGYNPNFTVGVWLGNFSGESIPQLSGAGIATPLLFQVFNTLNSQKDWFKIPEDIVYKDVCSISGLPKNEFCNSTQIDMFIDKVFYKNKCQHLKKVWVNNSESYSFCGFCLNKTIASEKFFPNYPSQYLNFLKSNGMSYVAIPIHNPNCNHKIETKELKIISPRNNGIYYVTSKNPQQIELKANMSFYEGSLFWYHNQKLLGKFKSDESVFVIPTIGENAVSCTDESGNTVNITFQAKIW